MINNKTINSNNSNIYDYKNIIINFNIYTNLCNIILFEYYKLI